MDVINPRCAGLDVHKDSISVHVRIQKGRKITREAATFGTTSRELLLLLDFLKEHRVTAVAMEATGVYWKPVWHILEGQFELVLANARDIKNVPGRKTDVKDAEWIADLLAHGLIRASFVPPAPIQELRDLTRTRSQLAAERGKHVQRIQKVLEDANLKLASVLSDILGKSGRAILDAMAGGEANPEKLAAMVDGRVKSSQEQLVEALQGRVTKHHRFMLMLHLRQIDALDSALRALQAELEVHLSPFQDLNRRLQTIPGVASGAAAVIMAEVGVDVKPFSTHGHLVSWACFSPGHNESAGKRRGTRTKPKRWLKPILVQAAWGAVREKNDTYLRSKFYRIRSRRGSKKAIVAVAASMLTAAYYIIRDGVEYKDLGGDYFDRLNPPRHVNQLVRRLQGLGYQVELKSAA
jgi:transposase